MTRNAESGSKPRRRRAKDAPAVQIPLATDAASPSRDAAAG
jgi:hypothetical protein